LTVIDAGSGQSLGTTTTAAIPANGQLRLSAVQIASNAQVPASNTAAYYVITVQDSFTGYLAHLVTNTQSGVVADLTGACSFPTP
jgi:hypothetical protein